MSAAPKTILNHVFGFPAFRGAQAEIVDRFIAGGDALVLMPTGGGKSICYQIPSIIREGALLSKFDWHLYIKPNPAPVWQVCC